MRVLDVSIMVGLLYCHGLGYPTLGIVILSYHCPLHLLLLVKLKLNVISLGSSGIRASYLLDGVR